MAASRLTCVTYPNSRQWSAFSTTESNITETTRDFPTFTPQTIDNWENSSMGGTTRWEEDAQQNSISPTREFSEVSESPQFIKQCAVDPPILKLVPETTYDATETYDESEMCSHWVDKQDMAKGCSLHVKVEKWQLLRIKVCQCSNINVNILQFDNGKRQFPDLRNYVCSGRLVSGSPVFSSTNDVTIEIIPSTRLSIFGVARSYRLGLKIAAVNKTEKFSLEVTYLTSSVGYIHFPHKFPFDFTDCLMITPPKSHVIFLTDAEEIVEEIILHLFTGECGQKLTEGKKVDGFPIVFPDWMLSHQNSHTLQENNQDPTPPMSLFFQFSKIQTNTIHQPTFKLVFSFHRNTAKPQLVGRKWNCSASVWPELPKHFSCDFIAQCVDSEDEANCSYTSKEHGKGYLNAGKSQIFMEEAEYSSSTTVCYSFDKLMKACRSHGALPVSFDSPQEWTDLAEVFSSTGKKLRFWLDLHQSVEKEKSQDPYIRNMYINTWQWGSGSVAYYLHGSIHQDACDCAIALIRNYQIVSDQVTTKTHACSRVNVFYETEKPFPMPLCKVPTPTDGSHKEGIVVDGTNHNVSASPVPLVTCPLRHVTHAMLACDPLSLCKGKLEKRGVSYTAMCRASLTQSTPYFKCKTAGEHVPYSFVCDWNRDCGDNSDESFCEFPLCGMGTVDCGQQQCLELSRWCDGKYDCRTSEDEKYCGRVRTTKFSVTKPPAVVNFDRAGSFTVTPLPAGKTQCPDSHYQCPGDGYCLPIYTRCNGMIDCPGHEDEAECEVYTCEGFYRCRGFDRAICMHVKHLCDGFAHCPFEDDELMCQMTKACPDQCVCYGTHFYRPESTDHVRYLDARGTGLALNSVLNNTMLIHLDVGACGWTELSDMTLVNLHVLDLGDNLLHDLKLKHLAPLKNLAELVLAGNPLSSRFSAFNGRYKLTNLLLLNLSRVPDQFSNLHILSDFMPKVQTLDLSRSGMKSLEIKQLFRSLTILNLRGCPISDFSPDFMEGMDDLQEVFGDNFKLCCSAVLPETFTGKCTAPADELSSCENLLKSSSYGVGLAIFGTLALFGNFGSFVYRLQGFFAKKNKIGFVVFVIHLCISDFLMGVYLSIIGVADRIYAGSYLWNEMIWKRSTACSIAGFLSFVSCEVSSFLICLITLDRFLVIRFPFSRLRFGITSAHMACTVIWILGMILASIPFLPVTSHWEFYRQTGLCIPLPITRADFPGRHYSFSVMIIVNFVIFMWIAAGQTLIYLSVRANAMPDSGSKNKDSVTIKDKSRSQEFTIARRLLVIAMSDFFCWFPIGVCGLLAKMDVAVSGEVNAAMATFVLPFNSALNPFLYTYTALRQKRQKEKETNLQKFISAQVKKELGTSWR